MKNIFVLYDRGLSKCSWLLNLFICTFFLLLTACGDGDDNCLGSEQCQLEILKTLDGYWQQEGYGRGLEFKDGRYQLYHTSSISCIKGSEGGISEGTIEEFSKNMGFVYANEAKDQFELEIIGRPTRYYFNKSLETHEFCRNGGETGTSNPERNFEIFWHTFNDHYAFFEERGVNWSAQYELYRPQVNNATTDDELFSMLSQMIGPLNDAHVTLSNSSEYYSSFLSSIDDGLYGRLREEFELQNEVEFFDQFFDQFRRERTQVIRSYAEDLRSIHHNVFHWGSLSEEYGYIAIDGFPGLGSRRKEVQDARFEIDAVLEDIIIDLQDKQGLVLDLRLNRGGADSSALQIAGHFIGNDRLAFTKKARDGSDFTESQEIYLEPSIERYGIPSAENRYLNPIIILTSNMTVSAAEVFILALLDRPQITRMGQTTAGAFSNVLARSLPNGWEFTLSNELYQATNGDSYEGNGFVPDTETNAVSSEDYEQGIDPMIESILN